MDVAEALEAGALEKIDWSAIQIGDVIVCLEQLTNGDTIESTVLVTGTFEGKVRSRDVTLPVVNNGGHKWLRIAGL